MDRQSDLWDRRKAMDDFHAEFSTLQSSEDFRKAIDWLRKYRESDAGEFDEGALHWIDRTIRHLEQRL